MRQFWAQATIIILKCTWPDISHKVRIQSTCKFTATPLSRCAATPSFLELPKKHQKEEPKKPEFQTENVILWCSTNKIHVSGSNTKSWLLTWPVGCLLDLLCVAAHARLSVKELEYLWQKRTSIISLFKENTPFNYSTFLKQSVSKKNRQVESLFVTKSQEQTLHTRKSCFSSSLPSKP